MKKASREQQQGIILLGGVDYMDCMTKKSTKAV